LEKNYTKSFCARLTADLLSGGISHFVSAPGARNAAVVRSLAENKRAKLHVHFDERGAGFFALGISKALGEPVAVICTSGSALANLMPAAVEAKQRRVPLVLISCDLPRSQTDIGENQSIAQDKFFGQFAVWDIDLPEPGPQLNLDFLGAVARRALSEVEAGPVHINCRIGKPYLGISVIETGPPIEESKSGNSPREDILGTGNFANSSSTSLMVPSPGTLKRVSDELRKAKRGLVLVGELPAHLDKGPIDSFLKELPWPVFSDITSGLRSEKYLRSACLSEKYSEGVFADLEPDLIVHLGGEFINSRVQKFILNSKAPRVLISSSASSQDPGLTLPSQFCCCPLSFCTAMLEAESLQDFQASELLEPLGEIAEKLRERVSQELKKETSGFSEVDAAKRLLNRLDSNHALFLGNSLSIRVFDILADRLPTTALVSNRGASGIDGLIATAAGVSKALSAPTVAVLGDQSALHDLNSLGILSKQSLPTLVFVINNGGGSIFSMLPELAELPTFDEDFRNKHSLNFSGIAQFFEIDYFQAQSPSQLEEGLDLFFSPAKKESKPMILEVRADSQAGVKFLQTIGGN